MYYFDVFEQHKEIKLKLIKEKIEIKKKAYYIYDIFGLENLKKMKNKDTFNSYCNICLEN